MHNKTDIDIDATGFPNKQQLKRSSNECTGLEFTVPPVLESRTSADKSVSCMPKTRGPSPDPRPNQRGGAQEVQDLVSEELS